MPVIVVGADTPLGGRVLDALAAREGEVRAFVTDPAAGKRLREAGIRVAVGDVSDGSHVSGAALDCFSAVLIGDAAADGRERSFAGDPGAVMAAWAAAVAESGVRRAIWVVEQQAPDGPGFEDSAPEVAVVETRGRDAGEVADAVASADDAAVL